MATRQRMDIGRKSGQPSNSRVRNETKVELGEPNFRLHHSRRDPVQHLWRGIEGDLHGHPLNDLDGNFPWRFPAAGAELGAVPELDAVNASRQAQAGKASTWIVAGWPGFTRVSCVSLKLAVTPDPGQAPTRTAPAQAAKLPASTSSSSLPALGAEMRVGQGSDRPAPAPPFAALPSPAPAALGV